MNEPALRFPEFVEDWEICPLSGFARMQSGYAFKSEDFAKSGIPVVRISNISADTGFVDLDGIIYHDEINGGEKFSIARGDILMALSGATTGKACVYNSDARAYLNQRVGLIKSISPRLHYQYLITLVFSNLFERQLLATLVAGAQPNVSPKDIEKFEFGFPSLPEQKKIAAFLGVVDAKIAALRDRQAGLERYKRGLMQALFSQRLRFTKPDGTAFPDWEEKLLGEVSEIYDGTHQTPNYVADGVPFFSVEQVTANNFERTKFIAEDVFKKESKRVILERDDILMTRIGDIGTCRLIDWDVRASFYVSLALVKCDKAVNSSFLNQFMSSVLFQRELWKRTIHVAFPKKINLGEVGNCMVQLPHPDEQQTIAEALSAMDAKIQAVTGQVEQMQTFKKGLLQQMFV